MDFAFNKDLFMAILNFVWLILTYGYIPHILMVFCISVTVMYLIILILQWQVIRYVVTDKYYFLKGYLYFWSLEKYYFIKSYVRAYWVIAKEMDSGTWFAVGIGIFITIAIIFLAFDYAISSQQIRLNETIVP